MKVGSIKLDEVKSIVKSLQGKNIAMIVNRGRNKRVKLNAVIDQVYPSLFVIKPNLKTDIDRTSFSYSDVLCGDITFLVEDNQTVDIKQEVE